MVNDKLIRAIAALLIASNIMATPVMAAENNPTKITISEQDIPLMTEHAVYFDAPVYKKSIQDFMNTAVIDGFRYIGHCTYKKTGCIVVQTVDVTSESPREYYGIFSMKDNKLMGLLDEDFASIEMH